MFCGCAVFDRNVLRSGSLDRFLNFDCSSSQFVDQRLPTWMLLSLTHIFEKSEVIRPVVACKTGAGIGVPLRESSDRRIRICSYRGQSYFGLC